LNLSDRKHLEIKANYAASLKKQKTKALEMVCRACRMRFAQSDAALNLKQCRRTDINRRQVVIL
jgi:hypothetical protein